MPAIWDTTELLMVVVPISLLRGLPWLLPLLSLMLVLSGQFVGRGTIVQTDVLPAPTYTTSPRPRLYKADYPADPDSKPRVSPFTRKGWVRSGSRETS